jgi:hypothetical protein
MKARRRTVLAFDLPPWSRFLWKTLENQRAAATANSSFIVEAARMISVAKGEHVRIATAVTWLRTEPTTIRSADRMKENMVIRLESSRDIGRVDSRAEDSPLTKDESVWIAYNVVNPKVTSRLSDTELANPETSALGNDDANGATAARVLKTAMIILSNLAILNAFLASSRSS